MSKRSFLTKQEVIEMKKTYKFAFPIIISLMAITIAPSANAKNVSINEQLEQTIQTPLHFQLPTNVPVSKGYYLTAQTKKTKNGEVITYYEAKKKLGVNANALSKTPKKVIAKLQIKNYNTSSKAKDEVGYTKFTKQSGQKQKLTAQIQAYQDAGAGQLYTSWNEGRWALTTHSYTSEQDQGVALAKTTVAYLDKKSLPVPKQYGAIQLDAVGKNHRLVLQRDQQIIQISSVQKPMTLLQIATSMK